MKIATWNINSLRARQKRLAAWLDKVKPDVVGLQEIKATRDECPVDAFTSRGYHVELHSEKGRNGVLLASRTPLEDVRRGLPGEAPDAEARVISARTDGVRVITVYAPNGQSLRSEAYVQKLEWYYKLALTLKTTFDSKDPLVLMGDMNVAPDDRDVHDPAIWSGGIHTSPAERAALKVLMGFGLVDALRSKFDGRGPFTWWDYSPSTLKKDLGLRIDLILCTGALVSRLEGVEVDRAEREPGGDEKPSDHAPVIASFR